MSRLIRHLTALVLLVIVVGWPGTAGAHTGFESSDPADGAVVSGPVSSVKLTFTGAAEPAGDGFVVLDPAVGERKPSKVVVASGGVFELRFTPPIGAGEIGVRWSVRAPDAHPIDGAIRFRVEGQAPSGGSGDPDASLDDFLAAERTSPTGRLVADVSRFFSMGATMVAVGFLVFCLTVMRGSRGELRMLLYWVRRAGVVVVLGTIGDALGQVADQSGTLGAVIDPGAYGSVLSGTVGLSLGARLVGGVIIASRTDLAMVHARHARDVVRSISARVPIGAGAVRVADHPTPDRRSRDLAWDLDRKGLVALSGFMLVLLSHILDGHTVTEGNRWLTGLASAMHVLAAGIWVGGVAALALIIRRRWRRDEPTHALVMVVRYSVVATIALAVVAIAGLYLAVAILDSPSELWTTEWGRIFVLKFVVVAVAAGFGAHNHHVIVPALELSEERPDVVRRLRSTLAKEVVALTGVTVITALLVRAASTL